MPKAKYLSDNEQRKIFELFKKGWSFRKIGRKLNRTHNVISNFIKNPFDYGLGRLRSGRKSKLTNRVVRNIKFSVGVRQKSLREVARNSSMPISRQTISRIMRKTAYRYGKMKKQIKLSPAQKDARVKFAFQMLKFGSNKMNDIIFTDEKRFNLDGPDGFRYTWHDLRNEKNIFSQSKYRGGIMVWGAIRSDATSLQIFLNCTVNSKNYVDMLEEALPLLYIQDINLFQQDNAPPHRALYTKQWFHSKKIDVLDWPANSPDLNLIENVWGILARRIYSNKLSFNNINELKEAITIEWSKLSKDLYNNLYNSFPDRLCKVIMKKGNIVA